MRNRIPPSYFEELSELQDGRCAICDEECVLVVDHCHDTGFIRGLLCRHCNCALGYLRDSPDNALQAMVYLLHHQQALAAIGMERHIATPRQRRNLRPEPKPSPTTQPAPDAVFIPIQPGTIGRARTQRAAEPGSLIG